jgi:hypothetical protein
MSFMLDNADLLEGDATSASEVDFVISGIANVTRGQLADGQLANSKGTLYTAASSVVVSSVIYTNTGAAHNHVNLYSKSSGGTSRRLIPKDLQLEAGYSLYFDGVKMTVLDAAGGIVAGVNVSDVAYAASWDGVTGVAPSKNAVYDAFGGVKLAGTAGKIITVTQDTALDEAVAMSSKAPKASPVFTGGSNGVAEVTLNGAMKFVGNVYGGASDVSIGPDGGGGLSLNVPTGEQIAFGIQGAAAIVAVGGTYNLTLINDSAGKPGAGGLWTVVSDERIKADIELADLDRCYKIIKSIPLKRFAWADGVYADEQVKDRHNLGWIAQDVQKVFPKAVNMIPFTKTEKIPDGFEEYSEPSTLLDKNRNPIILTKTRPKFRQEVIDDCLGLNSGQIIAAMYGCIQALQTKVEALEAKYTSK